MAKSAKSIQTAKCAKSAKKAEINKSTNQHRSSLAIFAYLAVELILIDAQLRIHPLGWG
jgi:hypothetical protein